MEPDVGVSITRDAGDITFASTETEAFFILAAHLPGFTKDEVELGINEREKQINIRGGGDIVCQEAVIAGRVAVTREISVECFDESFPVPDGVDWGGIDAWFDEEEKILIISIPKLSTGEHIMQVATERWDREEDNETAREDITPKGEKRPMETEVKMAAMGDDFTSSEEVSAAPEEFKKPVEGTEVETPKIVECRRTEAPKKELHAEHKIPKRTETLDVTEPEIREPLKAKGTDRKFHRQGEEDEQKQKKPQVDGPDQVRETEQLIESKKEYKDIQIEEHRDIKREKPELKIDDEVLEAELIESEKLEMELPPNEKVEKKLTGRTAYEKPIDAEWAAISKPEKELQETKEDEEPKLTGAGIEKRASIETKEEIQKQEQEHEKPAIVQKYEKSKDVGLPEKELKQRFHGFKEEDDRQLKGTDIEAFRARESLKKKELPLDLHKQNIEKPTLKEPKEMRAPEPTKTEKEENAEPKLQQPEEQAAQEPKKPIGLPYEKTSTKFQVPKESGQKLEQARIDAPEQMLKAAQDTQSESDEEMKQYEHKVREHKEPIAVPTCEMATVIEFPQKEEPKPQVHELYEDEDRQWMDGDKEEVMKQKAKKPAEKTQKQLFEVAESTKSGEKEAKIEVAQPEEQEVQEYKKPIIQPTRDQVSAEEFSEPEKPVQVHEKVGVIEPDQILQAAQQIQSEDTEEKLREHRHGAQEHNEFIGVPKYEKPEDAGLISKKEPKPALHALKEDEEKQWKIPDIRTPKMRESQDLHLEQVEKKHMIEKPYVKAPRQILKAEELSQQKEEEKEAKQQLEQPGGLETSESTKSTLHPPYEKHDTTQPSEPIEADQKHKPKLKELVQMLEAAQVQSEELEEGLKQHEQEVQEHAKSKIVPTSEKPQVTTPDQVLEEEEFQPELEKELEVPKEMLEVAEPIKTEKEEKEVEPKLHQPKEPEKQEEKMLIDALPHETGRKEKILTVKTLEIKGMPESQESYKKSEESLHVEAELQLEPPKEIEAHEEACPAVGPQLPDRTTVGPSERESQTEEVDQATESSIPRIQPPESKQQKELEGPRHRLLIEEESKEQLKQQFIQPDVEARKRESPPIQELARNGAIQEPPDRAACTKTLVEEIMEQDLYRSEEGELEQDIESPKLQKYPSFPSKLEDRKVPAHDETTVKPPKPLPRMTGVMEAERPPLLITTPKESTEPTITPPRIREAMESEGLPLLASSNEEVIEREFPAFLQKELHPYSDLQKAKEHKTAARQMPEFEESPAEQEGKPKEPPALHRAQEEIEKSTEEVPHKILEVPQPMKICEVEIKLYTPKELEEGQEENTTSPLDHDTKTLKEVSGDDAEASGAEINISTKVKKLRKRCRFDCRCPAFPIPPSTLLSGSAFVFSIMVLVFHFVKRKKPNY